MGLVTNRPVPHSDEELHLLDQDRWLSLVPLYRPSLTTVSLPAGSHIVIDRDFTECEAVPVIALSTNGECTGSVLSKSCVAALVLLGEKDSSTTRTEAQQLALVDEVMKACIDNGLNLTKGAVLIEHGPRKAYEQSDPMAVHILQLAERSEFDHILELLDSSLEGSPPLSFTKVGQLLSFFHKSANSTSSHFTDCTSNGLAIVSHGGDEKPFESAAQAVTYDINCLVSRFNSMGKGDVLTAHISCYNGMSELERLILINSTAAYLERQGYSYKVSSSVSSNATKGPRGWSVSIYLSNEEFLPAQPRPSIESAIQDSNSESQISTRPWPLSKLYDEGDVRRRIISGCNNLIESEPLITEYDTILGDGDCGQTLRDGAQKTIDFIQTQNLSQLPAVISALVDHLEVTMGGTSGALYCIFLSSLARSLWEAPDFPTALVAAQDELLTFTRARLGDRTMLDCLIPFINTLKTTGDLHLALSEAREGCDGTRLMTASVGRSSYLSETATRNIPDPGAVGLLKLLKGILEPK